MSRRIWWCDVADGPDGGEVCTRSASFVVTWRDEADEMMTMKVCDECLEPVRHSLTWDTPNVVEIIVAPFASGEVLA